jgi:CMP-N-acetylneuraminic acid synthetase
MNNIAVIIARGGSKGLLRKNLRPLFGKPLVAWTIEHALQSRCVHTVVLTSDDADILRVGESYGVASYERPAELASDTTTIDAAARHGVECWERDAGRLCDAVAILYANVALRPADLTDRALTKLRETQAHSVQTVYPVGVTHPLWMRKLTGPQQDRLENYQPNEIYRRQDLPPVYMLNSGVLAVRRTNLFDVDPAHPHQFLGTDRRAIVTAADDVVDIDCELDLLVAEAILKLRQTQKQRENAA